MINLNNWEELKRILGKTEEGRKLLKNIEEEKVLLVTGVNDRQQILRHIVENKKIALDDTINFSCNNCGKCCLGRDELLIPPYDLFKMAKELNISTEAFIKQYCEIIKGSTSLVPLILMKPIGSIKRCPMLKNRKCMVYNARPTVCAMYPLGRCAETLDNGSVKLSYVVGGGIDCGKQHTYTVQEWLDKNGITPESEKMFLEWSDVVHQTSDIIKRIQKRLYAKAMEETVDNYFISSFYLGYNPNENFTQQFLDKKKDFLSKMAISNQILSAGENKDPQALIKIIKEMKD